MEMIANYKLYVLLVFTVITAIIMIKMTKIGVPEKLNLDKTFNSVKENFMVYTFDEFILDHDFNTTFFIESSNAAYLDFRQSCSVEAAAKAQYPNLVAVYMTGIKSEVVNYQNKWINKFSNIKLIYLETDTFFKKYDLEPIYYEVKYRSNYRKEQFSDLMRLVLIMRCGGLYMDLDSVLMKSTSHLPNFMLKEFKNGIMKFQKGHKVATEAYNLLKVWNFNTNSFIDLGRNLLEIVAEKICKYKKNEDNYKEAARNCNLTFLDVETFIPVLWRDLKHIFPKAVNLESFKDDLISKAYAMHFFSSMSHKLPVVKNKGQIYDQLAIKFCPTVHDTFPKFY